MKLQAGHLDAILEFVRRNGGGGWVRVTDIVGNVKNAEGEALPRETISEALGQLRRNKEIETQPQSGTPSGIGSVRVPQQ